MKNQTNPMAYIAIKNNRLKHYNGSTVYLKHGTEFQIELCNYTQDTYAARITIDNQVISFHDLVLKPGTHYYLDRFININKKFLFNTYEVDANNKDVENAIAHNGNISVSFYQEDVSTNYLTNFYTYSGNLTITADNATINGRTILTDNTYRPTIGYLNSNSYITTGSYATYSVNASNNLNSNTCTNYYSTNQFTPLNESKKETGRVEKGSKSNQEFIDVHDIVFETNVRYTTNIKLLPESEMKNNINTINIEDYNIRNYCVHCGRKIKSIWIYCPNCGCKA